MSLPSHMSTLGSLKPSYPVVTSVPSADWNESDSDSPSFVANKPAAMKSPAALTFGSKTYDGSAAQTLTAADLGALTAHQDISGKADKSTTYTKTETDSAISTAVSAVKDSAPAAFDTLKEIADWIGDSGSGAQAVINQVAGKANKVASATTGNFAGLDANGNLTDSGKKAADFATAAQGAKADAALSRAEAEAGFTEWIFSGIPNGATDFTSAFDNGTLEVRFNLDGVAFYGPLSGITDETSVEVACDNEEATISHIITATRTRLPTMADVNAKEDASNKATALSASSTDAQYPSAKCVYDGLSKIPYDLPATALSPAAEWQFFGDAEGLTLSVDATQNGDDVDFDLIHNAAGIARTTVENTVIADVLLVTFDVDASTTIVAAKPYALLDRAMNRITLATLPPTGIALAFPAPTDGKVRDFLLRLETPAVGANGSAPQIAYPEGVTFENADGSFPEIAADENAACATLLMFTETKAATTGAGATPACFLVKGEALKEVS